MDLPTVSPRPRSGIHRPPADGGEEARGLLRALARRAWQVDALGEPRPGAWPAVCRMRGWPPGWAERLGYLWRGDRALTDLWRDRLTSRRILDDFLRG